MQQISVAKEYNIRRHHESHHDDEFRNLQGKTRTDKVKESVSGLRKQSSVISHSMDVSDAAVS